MSLRQARGDSSHARKQGKAAGSGHNAKKPGGPAAHVTAKGGGALGAPPPLPSSSALPSASLPPTSRGTTRPNTLGDQSRESSNKSSASNSKIQNGSNADSHHGLPLTPDASEEVSRAVYEQSFAFQFGSISPGFVNGLQIPARTSSAPPNLDEQNRHQARYDSTNAASLNRLPIVSAEPQAHRQNQILESQVQGRRYLHDGGGHPISLAQQHPTSGITSPVLFQQTQSPPIAVQMQYSAPSSQQLSGTPPRPPPTLPSPALRSQQVLMQQGQRLNVQSHILPPSLHGMPQHINPIGGQFSSQQLPQIVHHLGTQMSLPMGTKLPSGISGTQFRSPVMNHHIPARTNKAVKITHPETHEELRFDSSGKKSESDNAATTSLPGSVSFSRPPGVSHAMNFYPVQTGSYGHPSSTFYPHPRNSVPPQRSNSVHQSPAQIVSSGMDAQSIAPKLETSGASSTELSRPIVHDGAAFPVSLTRGHGITQTCLTSTSEKDMSVTSSSTQTQDTHLLSNATGMPQSKPLDLSEQLFTPADSVSSEVHNVEPLGSSSSSVANEVSVQSCGVTKPLVVSATDDIKLSMTCTTVSAQSVPVVDKVSSCATVSAQKLGPKTSGHENPKGDSVKASGSTAREHSKKKSKKKSQRKAPSTLKYDDSKEASVSSDLTRNVNEKMLKLPQEPDSVSVVSFSSPVGISLSADERSSTLHQLESSMNGVNSLNVGTSTLLTERVNGLSGPVYDFVGDSHEAINKPVEYIKPVDNVRSGDIGQVTEKFNKLELSGSVLSEADAESDATVRDFKIQSTAEIPSGVNVSVNNLDAGNNIPIIKSQAVHQFESQTKDIYNSESYSENLSVFHVNHGQSNDIVSTEGVCESNNLFQSLPTTEEIKGEELSLDTELSTAPDEPHEKHLSSDVSVQELSFSALDGELTLLEVNRKENKDSTAIAARFRKSDSYQLKEVPHDTELPSVSSGICGEAMAMDEQFPSFSSEFKAEEVLYGAAKKGNANLRDKPMNIGHNTIEKNESTPPVTNHQAVATASIGAGNKRAGSKKKKRKDCLAKADASSSAGDLYNAYKAPEEKQKDVSYPDASTVAVAVVNEKAFVNDSEKESQKELDDWEDVAEFSTQNEVTEECAMISTNAKQMVVPKARCLEDRKYTRDFLLTFKDQFRKLPVELVQSDIMEILSPSRLMSHMGEIQTSPNLGRALDWQLSGNVRPEHLGNNLGAEDKWNRSGGSLAPGKDIRVEVSPGGPTGGFRPGQGINPGLLRNVRGAPMNAFIASPNSGGPLTQMHVPPGGFPRNTSDADRWQRAPASSQKGLFSSPRNNFPAMHKAENKYEVGKVSDDEQLKQRQIKAILNKLTPQNFDKLFEQVKEVDIDSALTLTGVISQIFDKALMEPTFCEMYSKFCVDLAADLPEFNENNEKITFRRVLLNKCQEEFERGEREQAEADRLEEEGEVKLSNEEREEKRIKARRRMLGNIRFIGELYKMSMLTERIMHECIKKLLGEFQYPDEEDLEALCKLMSTIGHMIDRAKARVLIDGYFDRMMKLSNDQKLSSRLRFLLKDVIDLRKNGWQQRRKVEGPKKIEEVHRDAVQERQAHGGRSNRGTGMGSSGRRVHTPPDYSSRGSGSMVYSSGQPVGSSQQNRGAQAQMGLRGFGGQDVRLEDRPPSEKRSMQMHLTHRPDDVPIALVPQGSLSRVMSHRGNPGLVGRSTLLDVSPILPTDNRRVNVGQMQDRAFHMDVNRFPVKEDVLIKIASVSKPPNSLMEPLLEKTVIPERNTVPNVRRDSRRPESSIGRSEVTANHGSQLQNLSPVQVPLTEKRLREKSDMAIKEYYSVRDEDEAALCMDELKAPWFHSNMVSQWVTDSFDRNNVERDLLAKLLIYLCDKKPNLLSHEQLLMGLEISLSSLEDTVVDAPRAPEFIGVIIGKLVVAEILSLAESARIIKGETGHLLEIGLALDVITSVLEFVRREKGEVAMTDMYRTSRLQLEDFMPCGKKHGEFEAFLEKKKLQYLYPLIPVENQISEFLTRSQPVEQILKWVEMNVPPLLQSEPEFLKMLTIQVLRCCVPRCTLDYEKDLKGKLVPYAPLLRHFAPSRHKQRHYITAIQLFVNELDHPVGLMTALFNNFYADKVILEDAYFSWQDDLEDTTPGKHQAIREVGKWLSWLTHAPEAQN